MDYSFKNATAGIEKNFTRSEQVKETTKKVGEKIKDKEEKEHV